LIKKIDISWKKINSLVFILINIKLFSRISLLELYPGSGVQYARSSGVFAKFIKINWLNHTGIIQLPSGVRKAFSLYSITSLGAVSLRDKRLVRNTKAGFYKSYGLKSKVRGVAMNPIDHPHGGRTKAIKNQRTPWGKPTKLK
jgi:large subunit ribosomal protein L2